MSFESVKSESAKPRALLLDFDGVLVDTEPVHMRAWQEVLTGQGLTLTSENFLAHFYGLNDRDFLSRFFAQNRRELPHELRGQLIAEKEKTTKKVLVQNIPLIEGVREFLPAAAKKYPLALVTGSLPGEVDFVLRTLGWKKYFSMIVTAADVKEGKPSPEGFLKAFERLAAGYTWNPPLQKSQCLILEDSDHGVAAAQKAGIPHRVVHKTLEDARRSLCEK